MSALSREIIAIRRRLERWELKHLRVLAAELKERLEEAESRAMQLERAAESWREDALALADERQAQGLGVGLTQSGHLVAMAGGAA